MPSETYLSIGTNLGDRRQNLQKAINSLGERVAVESISSVYETDPWGVTEQPDFYNICIGGSTNLSPSELLDFNKQVERDLGRKTGEKWGPRIIDIDIVFFGDRIVNQDRLRIPHPDFRNRAFVLVPLNDIASQVKDPASNLAVSELLPHVDGKTVRLVEGKEGRLRFPKQFAWGVKTYVMAILNATPDSFSGDGLVKEHDWLEGAIEFAKQSVENGADIVDVGGQSTRPGSEPIPAEVEMSRVIPLMERLRDEIAVPISIDTFYSAVARAALEAGADWINDVWGLRMDPHMAALVGEAGCPVVIMHNRSKPKNVNQQERLGGRYVGIHYRDLFADIREEIVQSIKIAHDAGVLDDQIIIDPGIGFGKTVEQNLKLINGLGEFKGLGYPILIGTSRKSFIGYTLDVPPDDRIEGTAATVAIAIDRGADIIRVHDVREMARVAKMTDRIVRPG